MPVLAIGAVELVGLILALAALLIGVAFWMSGKVLARVLGVIPFIGSSIASAINSLVSKAITAEWGLFDSYVNDLAHFIVAISVGLWSFVYKAVQTLMDAKLWAVRAVQHADQLFGQAEGAIAAQAQALEGDIAHALQTAEATAARDLDLAEGFALSQVAGLEADIANVASDVISEANRVLGEAEAFTTGAVAEAEALAQALSDEVSSEAVRLFGQAEAVIGTIEGDIAALPGIIEGTIPGIVEGVVPGIIAGAIPGILAQVIPRVAAIEGEITECLEPLCDTVTPQAPRLGHLGQLFQDLESLGIEALIIALAAECLTDPGAVASDVNAVISDVGEPILTGFRDLIGA